MRMSGLGRAGNMRPFATRPDLANVRRVNPVPLSESRVSVRRGDYLSYLRFIEAGKASTLALCVGVRSSLKRASPLPAHVSHVVLVRPEEQMVGVHARRVVAAVANVVAGRDRAAMNFPSHPACSPEFSVDGDHGRAPAPGRCPAYPTACKGLWNGVVVEFVRRGHSGRTPLLCYQWVSHVFAPVKRLVVRVANRVAPRFRPAFFYHKLRVGAHTMGVA